MQFKKLNLTCELQPLSTKQSRIISTASNNFSSNVKKEDGDAAVAKFLTDQVYFLLTNVYKQQLPFELPSAEDFEDYITLDEVCSFLNEQVKACGPNDFLMRTINVYLQGVEQISSRMDKVISDGVDKALSTP